MRPDDEERKDLCAFVGARLRSARHKKTGLSITEMSHKFGVPVSTISSWERGTREMSVGQFVEHCERLGLDPGFELDEVINIQRKTKGRPR